MTTATSIQKTQPLPGTVAFFISDLHLRAELPLTTQAFHDFLQAQARHASQLYLLGDIFEYWAGDDDLVTPYNHDIVAALRQLSDSGVALFWISGNRDFLVAQEFAAAAGLQFLDDPQVVTIAGRQLTLAHGDAQCTDDVAYMAFRAQVRQAAWQQQFLAMPLAQRKAIIEGVRKNSQEANKSKDYDIMDVNADAITALFEQTGSHILIHGHTHRPACHLYGSGDDSRVRYVLPDWEYDVAPVRGGWMSITDDGVLHRFDSDGHELPPAAA